MFDVAVGEDNPEIIEPLLTSALDVDAVDEPREEAAVRAPFEE